ncbi:MAG: hypothetical protein AAFZ18_24785 [Myxococcota bacterium]
MNGPRHVSFVLLTEEGLQGLPTLTRVVLGDAWLSGHQIGFGPPLVGSPLGQDIRAAPSALDKLAQAIEGALMDVDAARAFAREQRRRLVRQLGPLEAEALDAASEQVFDLSLRLFSPARATPEVAEQMRAHGVTEGEVPPGTPPEALTGRLRLHLHDPRGARLLDVPVVAAAVEDAETAAAVELRAPGGSRAIFQRWLVDLESRAPDLRVVDLGEPTSHARVRRSN